MAKQLIRAITKMTSVAASSPNSGVRRRALWAIDYETRISARSFVLHEYQAGDEPYDLQSLGTSLLAWFNGDLRIRILGGESGEEVAQRVHPVLDDLVHVHEGKTVLVVIHGGAIIATLGSVAPGKAGLPTDGNPHLLEQDIAGGASFSLERRPDGWIVLPRTTS